MGTKNALTVQQNGTLITMSLLQSNDTMGPAQTCKFHKFQAPQNWVSTEKPPSIPGDNRKSVTDTGEGERGEGNIRNTAPHQMTL